MKYSQGQNIYFSNFYKRQPIIYFFAIMLVVSIIFSNNILPLHLWIFNIVSVLLFFVGSNYFSKKWIDFSSQSFLNNLFKTALYIRVIAVMLMYAFYMLEYDCYYGPKSIATDATWYVDEAYRSVDYLLDGNNIVSSWIKQGVEFSDTGYMVYLVIVYILSFKISDVVIPILLKALWGTLTCVLIYKISSRHFTQDISKLAAIFCMLCPNMIWWCGCLMKETEMIFLSVLFVNQVDNMIVGKHFNVLSIITAVLIGGYLFMYRTVLGMVCFLSLFFTLVFTSTKVVGWGKRILIAILALGLTATILNEQIESQINEIRNTDIQTQQQQNMEWRMNRHDGGGNKYAKYAGAAVFAPLIFAIPFPTLSYTYLEQELIMENAGGNYVKNVTSFFVILCMLYFLLSGHWKNHVLLISFTLGYLVVLVFSTYAQSGRFHMPIVPFEMMFAAYGYSIVIKGIPLTTHIGKKRTYIFLFKFFLLFELIVCVAWQWFKLTGQGLI